MDLVVPLRGQCSARSLLQQLTESEDDDLAVVDLREATWVDPIGLVGVASFVESERAAGHGVRLFAPLDVHVANYVSRMRLGRLLEQLGAEHDLKPVCEQLAGDLLELTRFEGEEGAEDLAALVFEKTASDEAMARALHKSICEIGANVPEHSGRPWGYVAAQLSRRRRRFYFAVGDAGRGVAATLADLGDLDDEAALRLVLEEGVSSTGEPGRGRGILETRRLATSLGGSVQMISGAASRTAYLARSRRGFAVQPWAGTLLQGSIPCR